MKLNPEHSLSLGIPMMRGITELANISPHSGKPEIKKMGFDKPRESYSTLLASALTTSKLTLVREDISLCKFAS
jgi:type VI protein secretion system component Hcp